MAEVTIRGFRDGFVSGEQSARSIAESTLAAVEAAAPLNAFLAVAREQLLADAEALDAARGRGDALAQGPLAGVPVAIKDNLCVRGLPMTCGSRILSGFTPLYDAHVVERLRAAGALIVGKTNLDEFAMGSSGENSAHGPARNPWDPTRVPGGSSSGSAVSVAAGVVPLSLGSDTGGSIREPASFCGVVGFKPTYGSTSRRGLVAFASSLDQVGPFARTVADAAACHAVIAGWDAGDATSSRRAQEPIDASAPETLEGLRIGLAEEFFGEGLDSEVEARVRSVVSGLVERGATLVPVSMSLLKYAVATYYLIASAEASSNLARFDGVRYGHRSSEAKTVRDVYARSRAEGFGPEVRRRIMLGTYALSAGYYDAYFRKAQQVRAKFVSEFAAIFGKCDVLITPTAPEPAFALGANTSDPLKMYLADICTIPVNLAGLPGISVPTGLSSSGLPIGTQVVAGPWQEATLFRVAAAIEALSGTAGRAPGAVR